MTEKTEKAILRIVHAAEIAEHRGNKLVLAYSGGKDSDVLLDLALKSGVNFIVQHNHTTVEAPETVAHIKEVFAELRERGIKSTINMPEKIEVNGKLVTASMWNLIVKKKSPPYRTRRYCCEFLKERKFDGQHIMTGVRWAESPKRKTRGLHEKLDKNEAKRIVYFDENDDAQKLTSICQLRSRIATNPVIDWSDADVWCYIKENKLKINPLYGLGFSRVGCIGCPMASLKMRNLEFQMYPKYKTAYIRAFQKMIDNFKKEGLKNPLTDEWKDGKSVFEYWLRPLPKKCEPDTRQISLFDTEEDDDDL